MCVAQSVVPSVSPFPQAIPEPSLEAGDLTDEVSDGVGEGLLGAVVRSRLHTQHKLGLQRVGDLVAGKHDLGVPQQLAVGGKEGEAGLQVIVR